MDKLRIFGGIPLKGTVHISGAKNAALPAMAASLLAEKPITLRNVPAVNDIKTFRKLLNGLGAEIKNDSYGSYTISAREILGYEAPYELVKTMRASVLSLGPLLARCGHARVSLPGGCAIGARPVNLHIAGLERLGAKIAVEHGYIEATCGRLKGAEVNFETVTVTGTENLMMAATLAEGETTLLNAACEPEVIDLADLLNKMGAEIQGAGTNEIKIRGVKQLAAAEHSIIPDRIEAGTFMIAAAMTAGDIELKNCRPAHLSAIISKLRETGTEIVTLDEHSLRVARSKPLRSVDVITQPYPGFPTDMQAQFMVLMTQGDATSVITEMIFENRFMHGLELMRMGADIRIEGNRAVVSGGKRLSGARVIASDLRASACLVLAGISAEGETIIDRVYHMDRGYERIEEKFRLLGAKIDRIGAS